MLAQDLQSARIPRLVEGREVGIGDRAPDRLKPSVVGGIGVTFKINDRKCYVEFYNNGTVYALFSDGLSDPETYQIRPTAQDYLDFGK